jgi:putative transposase
MINCKNTQRLYREERIGGPATMERKRAVGTRAPARVLALPNQRWSLEFVHNQMASERRFRVLNVVDEVTRGCLAPVPTHQSLAAVSCANSRSSWHSAANAG